VAALLKLGVSKKVAAVSILVSLAASSILSLNLVWADSRVITVPYDYPNVTAAVANVADGDCDDIVYVPCFISEKKQDNYPLIVPVDVSDDINSSASPSPSPSPSSSPSPPPSPGGEFSSTTTLVAFVVSAAVVVIGLALYFRKRDH
jgi:hypothetical protein